MLGSTGQLMTPVLCTATQRQLGMLHDGYPPARVNQLSTMASPMPTATQKQADLESIMADFPKVFDGVCRVMDGPLATSFSTTTRFQLSSAGLDRSQSLSNSRFERSSQPKSLRASFEKSHRMR